MADTAHAASRAHGSRAPFGSTPVVRWCLLGASTIAREHMGAALASASGSEVTAVWSSSRSRGAALAADLGVRDVYADLDAVLANRSISAVYVSGRNSLHAPQVLAAAAAGKHVLCEKPLAVTLAEATKMVDACEDAGVVLAVNHPLRTSAVHSRMRALIAEGMIGNPIAARVLNGQFLPPPLRTWRLDPMEAGSGVIYDLTVHDADLLRFVLRSEIRAVTAVARSSEAGSIEAVSGTMELAAGADVGFHDAFNLRFAGTALEVHGDEGSLIAADNMTAQPSGRLVLRRADGDADIRFSQGGSAYAELVRGVNAAIRGNGPPPASGKDGVESLCVAIAAQEAATTGRRVDVPQLRRGGNGPEARTGG